METVTVVVVATLRGCKAAALSRAVAVVGV